MILGLSTPNHGVLPESRYLENLTENEILIGARAIEFMRLAMHVYILILVRKIDRLNAPCGMIWAYMLMAMHAYVDNRPGLHSGEQISPKIYICGCVSMLLG